MSPVGRLVLCFCGSFLAATFAAGESLPLRIEANFPLLEVKLNGAGPFLFLVDTGADGTMATPQAMTAAGLLLDYRVDMIGSTGRERVAGSSGVEVQLGALRVPRVDVIRHDLSAVRRINARIQGVLGQNVLRGLNYLIGYGNRRMLIGEEATIASADLGARPQSFQRIGGRMAVEGMPAGRAKLPLTLIFDSGASGLALLDRRPRVQGATLFRGTAFNEKVQSYCGAGYVTRARLAELVVGEHRFSDLNVSLIPDNQESIQTEEDGMLPTNLYRAFYVNNQANFLIAAR